MIASYSVMHDCDPQNFREAPHEHCFCGEWEVERCYRCHAAMCEQHARKVPGFALFVCEECEGKDA